MNWHEHNPRKNCPNTMTPSIEQYAAKWATAEHRATSRDMQFIDTTRGVIFEWAKDDANSPVAKLLSVGVSESTVKSLFDKAFLAQLEILQKLDA